jgi:hypothetical protein
MKKHFIFITLIFLIFCSCASSKQNAQPDGAFIISGTYQYWFGKAPGEPEISERGIDIIIELSSDISISGLMHVIFNERKSFSLSANRSEDDASKNYIEATILLDSSLFNEISEHVRHTNRLVYHDGDGDEQFEELKDLQRLPDRYEY